MWNSKQNRLVLFVSAFVIIVLFTYALLRDKAEIIPLERVQVLLDTKQVQKVIATDKYIYLVTEEGKFKIAGSQVNPAMFAKTEVEIEGSSTVVMSLLVLVLVLGIGSIAFRWWQKRDGIGQTGMLGGGGTASHAPMNMEKIRPSGSERSSCMPSSSTSGTPLAL